MASFSYLGFFLTTRRSLYSTILAMQHVRRIQYSRCDPHSRSWEMTCGKVLPVNVLTHFTSLSRLTEALLEFFCISGTGNCAVHETARKNQVPGTEASAIGGALRAGTNSWNRLLSQAANQGRR